MGSRQKKGYRLAMVSFGVVQSLRNFGGADWGVVDLNGRLHAGEVELVESAGARRQNECPTYHFLARRASAYVLRTRASDREIASLHNTQ